MKKTAINKNSEILKSIFICVIVFVILYLFYRSFYVLILMPVFVIFYIKYSKRNYAERKKDVLNIQFRDVLVSLAAALRAGYSIENALKECQKEMTSMYGSTSLICNELTIISNEMKLGCNAETAFENFARRSQVEDISTFASVFKISKRSGGNLVEIIKQSADTVSAKIDTKNEIAVLVSAKRFEQNIMSLMPAGIILYINLTMTDLLDPLYGNITGILIMTVCLAVYIFAFFLSRKIMRIEI